mmetsp:Transcript_8100/g.19262  ORF Transcript_8100/g.19262 Transcript_8100/m.19262 type:complete len:262 (-) Transcript_8100:344-1129(-)
MAATSTPVSCFSLVKPTRPISGGRPYLRAAFCSWTSLRFKSVAPPPRALAYTCRTLAANTLPSAFSASLGWWQGRKSISQWLTTWQNIRIKRTNTPGPDITQHGSKWVQGYFRTAGCTGTPGVNAPSLNSITMSLWWVVPSGNRNKGSAFPELARRAWSVITFRIACRPSADPARRKKTIPSARAGLRNIHREKYSCSPSGWAFRKDAANSPSIQVQWFMSTTPARGSLWPVTFTWYHPAMNRRTRHSFTANVRARSRRPK